MTKNYSSWHKLKTRIENQHRGKLFHEREIWWCSLGANIGFEQDGKNKNYERPVLVIRKFNKGMLWGLPLTSIEKHNKFHYFLKLKNKMPSWIILSQLRVLSSKRLIRRIVRINENTFYEIEKKTIELLKEKNGPQMGSSGA